MAGPGPEADVADLAAVGGVGLEGPQLGVAPRLDGQAGGEEQEPGPMDRSRRRATAVGRRGDEGQEEDGEGDGLLEVEDRHLPGHLGAVLLAHPLVTPVLLVEVAEDADGEVRAEAEAPERHRRRQPDDGIRRPLGHDQPHRPRRQREGQADGEGEAVGPGDVDDRPVVHELRDDPGEDHQRERRQHGHQHRQPGEVEEEVVHGLGESRRKTGRSVRRTTHPAGIATKVQPRSPCNPASP